jgi:hypothetical protein
MTTPTVELSCDTCAEHRLLYRLHGTDAALCARCFTRTYAPESVQCRPRRARTSGPAVAGCLRTMRVAPAVSDVHRFVGRGR